jgi:hypothetical protein
MKEQRKQKAHTCGVISLLYLIEWERYLYDIFRSVYDIRLIVCNIFMISYWMRNISLWYLSICICTHTHTHTQRERERESFIKISFGILTFAEWLQTISRLTLIWRYILQIYIKKTIQDIMKAFTCRLHTFVDSSSQIIIGAYTGKHTFTLYKSRARRSIPGSY